MNKYGIILPYKENFSKKNSGAASLHVKESLEKENLKNFLIYGSKCNIEKKYKNYFLSYNEKAQIFKNFFYIKYFIKKCKKYSFDTIEIHNRPEYVKHIKKAYPKSRIIFFFHNLPSSLRGSKSISDKTYLYESCEIYFISKNIEKNFYKNTNLKVKKNSIIYPGFDVSNVDEVKKKKDIILFCGKLNSAKGYDIFCEATKKLKENKKFKKWKILSIGTESRRSIPKYKHVKELGQISNKRVFDFYKKAKISIAPSIWDEPLGRLPTESSSRGCIPITSNKGGLIETNLSGYVIKNINVKKLYKKLLTLCSDKKLVDAMCKKQILNFKFKKKFFYHKIKKIREIKNIKKILIIANFNLRAKKLLFYSFFNKLKFSIKNSTYNYLSISDRDLMRNSRSIFDLNGSILLNKTIINYVKRFNPDLIILGHTNKIYYSTFKKIRQLNHNIKIIKIYIDSLSKEFFKFEKIFYDYKFLDAIFTSSNPSILSNLDYHKKIYFIPYIVNKKIDYLKSYINKKKKYDVFFALSHGQNRMILKPGKFDERDKFLNLLKNKIKKVKYKFCGTNGIQPVWGKKFYSYLNNSKIAINLSRGNYKSLYSSDRIASLMGNGLCVINEKTNRYSIFFNKQELLNFKNVNDLSKKIFNVLSNDKYRIKIARNGYKKIHKLFSSKNVLKYIINKTLYPNKNISEFDKIINKKIKTYYN